MSKGLVAFIVIACVAIALLLYNSMRDAAAEQHKASDSILEKFKTIDKSLQPYAPPADTGKAANDIK